MEKVVYILRHGKAENAEEGDFERRLTPVGEGDVREIGELLAGAGAAPGRVVASAAVRTSETAQLVAAEVGVADAGVSYQLRLYNGGVEEWLAVLYALPEAVSEVLLVGHNPVLEMLVRELCGKAVELPPGGCVVLDYAGEWPGVGAVGCRWRRAYFPGRYRERLPDF